MRKYLISLMLVSVVLSGTSLVLAVQWPTVIAEIPHPFLVGSAELPAGQYEFREDSSNSEIVLVRNTSTSKEIAALSETRLAAGQGDQYSLVFDVVGTKHYLSEIRLGSTDGFYFKAATGKHTHMAVKARKKS